jgi:hypothetical protein
MPDDYTTDANDNSKAWTLLQHYLPMFEVLITTRMTFEPSLLKLVCKNMYFSCMYTPLLFCAFVVVVLELATSLPNGYTALHFAM